MENHKISPFIRSGDFAQAILNASKSKNGLSPDERRSVGIAAECSNPARRSFYESIGVDWQTETEKAKSIISARYS